MESKEYERISVALSGDKRVAFAVGDRFDVYRGDVLGIETAHSEIEIQRIFKPAAVTFLSYRPTRHTYGIGSGTVSIQEAAERVDGGRWVRR